jgi:hypothetical protein
MLKLNHNKLLLHVITIKKVDLCVDCWFKLCLAEPETFL